MENKMTHGLINAKKLAAFNKGFYLLVNEKSATSGLEAGKVEKKQEYVSACRSR